MAINKVIDPIPDAPQKQTDSPEQFDSKADAFLKRLETFDDDLNTWADECNKTQEEINTKAEEVANARNATLTYRNDALSAKTYCETAAANVNHKGLWSSTETYSIGDTVSYDGLLWISNYNNNIGHTPGSDDYWTRVTATINNIGQLVLPYTEYPILVGGYPYGNRKFYVDPETGDDTNIGTAESPFASLKKAIDSIPEGGHGSVFIKEGTTVDLTGNDIIMVHKTASISRWGTSGTYTITSSFYDKDSSAAVYQIKLRNSCILFWYANFSLLDNTTGLNVTGHGNGLIQFDRFCQVGGVHFYYCTANIDYDSFVLISAHNYRDAPSFIGVSMYGMTVNVNAYGWLVVLQYCPIAFRVALGAINDLASTGRTSWQSLIADITYDTDGKPRNIISDTIF